MAELNDVQFSILGSLYFVESFETIVEEAGVSKAIVADEIQNLLHMKLIQVMSFDDEAGDYVQSIFHDSDDMGAFYYLATKQGLLTHNGI